jgi:hypothetical protein
MKTFFGRHSNVVSKEPVVVFQILSVLSIEEVARSWPFGENDRVLQG